MQLAEVDLALGGGGVGEELAAAALALADDRVRADRRRHRERHDDRQRREEVHGERVRRLRRALLAVARCACRSSGRLPTTSLSWFDELHVLDRSR